MGVDEPDGQTGATELRAAGPGVTASSAPDPAGVRPAGCGVPEGALSVLELVARGETLSVVLDALAHLVAGVSGGTPCAVFTVRDGDLVLSAAAGLPAELLPEVERVPGGANELSRAAPLAALSGFLAEAADRHGAGFGWGVPVVEGSAGAALGYLVFFTGSKRFPTEAESDLLGTARAVAAVAIERTVAADAAAASARVDPLTGLLNRGAFLAGLSGLAQRTGDEMTVVVVDLVGFAELNAAAGYATGDEVLRRVAGRLRATVRGRDLVARFGGDQFALAGAGRRSVPGAIGLPGRVRRGLAAPIVIDDVPVPVEAAIGVAAAPLPVPHPEGLLARAEAAARAEKARRSGRGRARAGAETAGDGRAGGLRGFGRRARQ